MIVHITNSQLKSESYWNYLSKVHIFTKKQWRKRSWSDQPLNYKHPY